MRRYPRIRRHIRRRPKCIFVNDTVSLNNIINLLQSVGYTEDPQINYFEGWDFGDTGSSSNVWYYDQEEADTYGVWGIQ